MIKQFEIHLKNKEIVYVVASNVYVDTPSSCLVFDNFEEEIVAMFMPESWSFFSTISLEENSD